jgi:hypothetical protein
LPRVGAVIHSLAARNHQIPQRHSFAADLRLTDESGVWAVVASLQLAGSPRGAIALSQAAPDLYEAELGPFTEAGELVITIIAQDFDANTAEEVRAVTVWDTCIEQ